MPDEFDGRNDFETTKPSPHPPHQAKHPGRARPAPHMRPAHEQTMKRPHEKLHLAKHGLHPHHEPKED